MAAKILLVEDEKDLRDLICSTLENQYEIACIDNMAALLELDTKKERPDIVLLNYLLPDSAGKSPTPIGLTLLRFIKRAWHKTEVIMFTACDKTDIAFQAGRLGAFDFVQKPCDNQKLLHVLQSAVEYRNNPQKAKSFLQNTEDHDNLTRMESVERDAIIQ
ncbi:MAG TPA: response regulator, partial [Candidatus Baltobacteraceae bacterium]|nr:response regulator [Candidatus Baltobacteraceae bacterium]